MMLVISHHVKREQTSGPVSVAESRPRDGKAGPLDLSSKIMEVERKPIPNCPSYFAGIDGTMWRCKNGNWIQLKPIVNTFRKGYLQIGPYVNGKTKPMTVHRAVMLAFVGPRPDGMEICHIDGDKTNNALSNLKYATPTENNADKKKHGTHLTGEQCHAAKLNRLQVAEIRRLYATGGYSQSQLASLFGVTQVPISQAINYKTWRDAD